MDINKQSTQIQKILSKQPFFIAGAQKSGTTWLQKLLDAHPEIVCSGEGHFYDSVIAPMGNVLHAYNNRLKLIAERVYENNPIYDELKLPHFQYLAQSVFAMMLGNRDINDAVQCVGDKTPINALYMEQLLTFFPKAKFIHIIRDGRDVVVSIVKHARRVLEKADPSALKGF